MDNEQVGIAMLAAIVVITIGALSGLYVKDRIANDCREMGRTIILWEVYECSPLKVDPDV